MNAFLLAFAITAVFLVISLVSGKKGKRRLHLISVIVTTVFLLLTIYLAKLLGETLNFPEDRHEIHMPLARLALYSLIGPWVTGPLLWYGKIGRKLHLITVILFVTVVTAAIVTGIWMVAGASPKF